MTTRCIEDNRTKVQYGDRARRFRGSLLAGAASFALAVGVFPLPFSINQAHALECLTDSNDNNVADPTDTESGAISDSDLPRGISSN